MTQPRHSRDEHEQFCRAEGWKKVRESGGDRDRQVVYELALADGQILRTRIRFSDGRSEYGPALWEHILRQQLHVSEETFRACVRHDIAPDRGVPRPDAEAIPTGLVHLLITRVGLTETEVKEMGKEQAISRLNDYWMHEV